MQIYPWVLGAHVLTGALALVLFWSTAATRKGSALHRKLGRGYLLAMLGVTLSALYLCLAFWLRGKPGIATFLAYLVVITGVSMAMAWRAIKLKTQPKRYFGTGFIVMAGSNFLSGVLVLVIGVQLQNTLLMAFSWVGILIGMAMFWQRRKPPTDAKWWLREHYGAILGCGVATHIAFLALGLNRLLAPFGLSPPSLLAWMLPLAVMLVARIYLDRRYGAPSAGKVSAHNGHRENEGVDLLAKAAQ